MYAFHSNGRSALPLRDEPVLFFDDRARRAVAIDAAKDFARHSAIGPLRTVFVSHVKKSELNSRSRLPCHFRFPVIVQRWIRHTSRAASQPSRHVGQVEIGPILGARA